MSDTTADSEPAKSVSKRLQTQAQSKDLTCNGNRSKYFVPVDKVSGEPTRERISTGSGNLDYLLGGGLELGEITQIYGGHATGKTHLCHTLCATFSPNYQVIYIDTEGTFREDRLKSITDARGLDWNAIRQKIQVAHPEDSHKLEACLEEVPQLLSNFESSKVKVRLLVLDSLMYHFRKEYPDRSGLAERSSKVNKLMYKLRALAKSNNNIAVVITNQRAAKEQYENRKPFGGEIVSYVSQYIIYLELAKIITPLPCITAKSMKNPTRRNDFCKLIITDNGFSDKDGPREYWRALLQSAERLRSTGMI